MMKKAVCLCVLALVALTACQKEEGGLLLFVEDIDNGSKMAVDGNVLYWTTGDQVRINGDIATVNITTSGNTATTTVNVAEANTYYGVYPASIYSSNTNASYTLFLPATYTYATTTRSGRTYQNLQGPMVGYTTNRDMMFKHVTAAVNVQIVNYYGFTIAVDSIVVSSDSYKLNGSVTVDMTNVNVTAQTSSTEGEKNVKMLFNGDADLHVFAGDSTIVQVPVLPVGSGNHFTVKVCVHKVDQSAVETTFEKTQNAGGALARAKVGYARFATPGLFSVSASKKVVISQGNLQYQASTGIWKFSDTQYGMIGSDNTNISSSYTGWIDLFGWGTSSWNNGNKCYQPYSSSNATSGDYASSKGFGYGPTDGSTYTYSLTGEYSNSDWGVYATISNGGGKGRWVTMTGNTGGEWDYLLSTRSASTINSTSNARYIQATVNAVQGIILFPDSYSHPEGVTLPNQINKSNNYWATNTYNLTDWLSMEKAGAVFMPRAGYRQGTAFTSGDVYYWSSTAKGSGYAYATRLGPYGNSFTTDNNRYRGNSVRLVREVN